MGLGAVLGFIAWQRGRVVLTASLREGTMDFINIVPRIALGVIGSGYIAAVHPAGGHHRLARAGLAAGSAC